MAKEEWHNHEVLMATVGGDTTKHDVMHIHVMPEDKGHTHEAIVGPATKNEEVPA